MEQPKRSPAIHVEGVDQEAVSHKVSEIALFILQKTGTQQDIGAFADELCQKADALFTPEEKTYLSMMYCASTVMRMLQQTPLGAMYGFDKDKEREEILSKVNKVKPSPDENA